MAIVDGKVFRVHTKDWQGKNLYSFKLDGGGDNDWYRMGEKRHAGVIEEGYVIRVEYSKDKRDNLQVERVKLLEKGEPVKASGGNRGSGGGRPSGGGANGLSKDEWAEKDLKIQYQSARNAAIEYVQVLISNEIIKLPAKTKADERKAVVDGYLDFYTAQFYLDTAGKAAVGRADGELATADTLPAGEPATAETESDDDWGDDDSSAEGGDSSEW